MEKPALALLGEAGRKQQCLELHFQLSRGVRRPPALPPPGDHPWPAFQGRWSRRLRESRASGLWLRGSARRLPLALGLLFLVVQASR